jgi:hypothetical protein
MSESTETASSPGAVSGSHRNCCATARESSPPLSAIPAGRTTTRPPATEIFYTKDEQRQVAEETIADASGFWGAKVVTKISKVGRFWEAEAEDQDYLQRYTDGNNQFTPHRSAVQ